MANLIGRDMGRFLSLAAQVGLPAYGAMQNIQQNQLLQQIAQERLRRLQQENAISQVAAPAQAPAAPIEPVAPLTMNGLDPINFGITNRGGIVG